MSCHPVLPMLGGALEFGAALASALGPYLQIAKRVQGVVLYKTLNPKP